MKKKFADFLRTPKQACLKRIGTLIVVLTLSLLSMELSGILIKAYVLNESLDPRSYGAAYEKKITENFFAVADFQGLFLPNPLFGYQINPQVGGNNHGFISKHDYPYRRKPDEFVIGISGGSVAHELGVFLEKHEKIFSELFSEKLKLKNKRISFLNFALPGFKQPQQFIVSSTFGESVDLMITLDGFNETIHEMHPAIPREYPTLTLGMYYEDFNEITGRGPSALWKIRKFITVLPLRLKVLKYSTCYEVLWKVTEASLARMSKAIERERMFFSKIAFTRWEPQQKRDESLARKDMWAKYSRLQTKILRDFGVPNYHFIQPSPYFKNSKPFSEEEKKFWRDDAWPDPKPMSDLIELIPQLRSQGHKIYDLTKVFSAIGQTIYRDGFCHVNDAGNSIMAKAMLEIISKDLAAKKKP